MTRLRIPDVVSEFMLSEPLLRSRRPIDTCGMGSPGSVPRPKASVRGALRSAGLHSTGSTGFNIMDSSGSASTFVKTKFSRVASTDEAFFSVGSRVASTDKASFSLVDPTSPGKVKSDNLRS